MNVQGFYDKIAGQYDGMVSEYETVSHRAVFEAINVYLSPKDRVLDLGIGTGLCSHKLSQKGVEVSGIDISSEMLATCRMKRFTKTLEKIDLRHQEIPFCSRSFDGAVASSLIYFLPELDHFFTEVRRVLNCEAKLAFNVQKTPYKNVNGTHPLIPQKNSSEHSLADYYLHTETKILECAFGAGFEFVSKTQYAESFLDSEKQMAVFCLKAI